MLWKLAGETHPHGKEILRHKAACIFKCCQSYHQTIIFITLGETKTNENLVSDCQVQTPRLAKLSWKAEAELSWKVDCSQSLSYIVPKEMWFSQSSWLDHLVGRDRVILVGGRKGTACRWHCSSVLPGTGVHPAPTQILVSQPTHPICSSMTQQPSWRLLWSKFGH